ncbi:DUF2214 family protein [Devosia sp. 2618]|uniref:DUF2214 family protein n=1 Tax=Devosia sp. 2618 TaxID=3156454 RepID=UPI00339AF9A1
MDIDLLLAIGHHLTVFTLVGLFAAEFALLRPGISLGLVRQLGRIDTAYGIAAGAVIVVGVLRVIYGSAGWQYYVGNHAFWGKMVAILIVGLLSIPPTIAFRRWIKAGQGDAGYVVPVGEIKANRRYVHLQAGVLLFVPIFAAMMARGYGS